MTCKYQPTVIATFNIKSLLDVMKQSMCILEKAMRMFVVVVSDALNVASHFVDSAFFRAFR